MIEVFLSPSLNILIMLIEILVALIAGVLSGIIFKAALLVKYKKRVLHLEDEMLSNHSRILSLEKKNAEMETIVKTEISSHNKSDYKRFIV